MVVLNDKIILSRIFTLFFLLCSHVVGTETMKTLEQELNEVDKLRANFATPFDEVEKKCNELLKRYTKPEEQGKIYYELAKVEGQSGLQRPARAIEYVKKALKLPQEPWEKVRLYIYWGDAIQVANRGVRGWQLLAPRRKAVMPYLDGLKETLQYDLPEAKPELPMVHLFTYDGPPDSELHRKLKRKNQEEIEAWNLAKFQRDMIQHRDVLTGQVSSMYSRFPWASDEIRELATKILADDAAVERLMSHVDKAVEERVRELGWEPEPPNAEPPLPSDKDKTDSGAQPGKGVGEIFIPKADIALRKQRAFVLDLASGRLINPAAKVDSRQAYSRLVELGKGDIAWDGSLVTLRKAKVLTISKESQRPLKCMPARWCNFDRIPEKVDLPYLALVVTNEDVEYLISILEIKADGIRIKYKKLSAKEAETYYPVENKSK